LVPANPLNQPSPKSAGQVKVTKAQFAETKFLISETLLQYQPSKSGDGQLSIGCWKGRLQLLVGGPAVTNLSTRGEP
jgi:hypothetical protein